MLFRSADGHAGVFGEDQQFPAGRPGWNRFGQGLDVLTGEFSHVPIAGDAHFWKCKQVDVQRRRAPDKGLDLLEIGRFIARRVLKLHGGGAEVFHGRLDVRDSFVFPAHRPGGMPAEVGSEKSLLFTMSIRPGIGAGSMNPLRGS